MLLKWDFLSWCSVHQLWQKYWGDYHWWWNHLWHATSLTWIMCYLRLPPICLAFDFVMYLILRPVATLLRLNIQHWHKTMSWLYHSDSGSHGCALDPLGWWMILLWFPDTLADVEERNGRWKEPYTHALPTDLGFLSLWVPYLGHLNSQLFLWHRYGSLFHCLWSLLALYNMYLAIYDDVSLTLCDIAVMMCVNHSALSQTTSVDASATSQSHHPPKDLRAGTQLELSFSYELQQGYRILRELTTDSNKSFVGPFINPIDSSSADYDEYHRRVKCPVWLKQSKLINML